MSRFHTFIASIFSMTALWVAPGPAAAQSWPTQPVRIIVPYPGGGAGDILARALGTKLQEKWKQPVIIDLKPGANTVIGAEAAARATNGHTLFLSTDATFTINPHLYAKLPYDAVKDFTPITLIVSFPQMLLASNSLGATTLPDIIALAKAKPRGIAYGSFGPGSQPHLATENLKRLAGIDMVHVPYRGIGLTLNALIAGEVQLIWSSVPSSQAHIRAGSVKAVAFAASKRSPAFPQIPTMTELGYPTVEANVWLGLFAPSSMPMAQVQQINADVQELMADPEFQAKQVVARGYESLGLGPVEFQKYLQNESRTRAELIRISGAKAE